MKIIDLRSDTVTQPTPEMRAAMAAAEVGDDVYGEDPTVNRLEDMAAGLLGMEAAVFVPSGTQSNLIAIMSHCGRGDEYIVGAGAHCYRFEGGGAAVLGSVQPQPLPFEADGTLDLEKVEAAIKPDDYHFARTRLVCLENTVAGRSLPLGYLREVRALCRQKALALHLDGARLYNAAVAEGVTPEVIAGHFDTVSLCLSKGLGAPVGSVLCGKRDLIATARRLRKMVGGAMRQAGILAAAGIVALQHGPGRLAEDHENARLLAEGLTALSLDVCYSGTNMVFLSLDPVLSRELTADLDGCGIRVSGKETIRLVTHRDLDRPDIDRVVASVGLFLKKIR